MSFAQSGLAQFMAAPAGRTLRILFGLALIAWGLPFRSGAGGILLIVVGLLALATGVFDICVLSAFLGGPLRGAGIREAKPRT